MKRNISGTEDPISNKKKNTNAEHWSNGLLSAMDDPSYKVSEDDLVAVIRDKYPKAKFHYLVLPKEDIHSLKSVKKKHIELLKHMHDIGTKLTLEDNHKEHNFKLGYHAEASMGRLHLHVISDDMDSLCLKTKKHWNSFTTKFFVPSEDICEMLESSGKIKLLSSEECKTLMGLPLQCHKCDFVPKHMPNLKKHIFENHA